MEFGVPFCCCFFPLECTCCFATACLCFLISQGPHFNDECWHQGDTLDSRDWGLLQVQTNTERANMSEKDNLKDNLVNVPTFNLHHLHHLFPTIDAAELSKIVPMFEEHCEEFGVVFDRMTQKELAAGMYKCVDGYAPNNRTRNGIRAKL